MLFIGPCILVVFSVHPFHDTQELANLQLLAVRQLFGLREYVRFRSRAGGWIRR